MKSLYIIILLAVLVDITSCTKKQETTNEEHHDQEAKMVEFTPQQMSNAGVQFGKVEMRNLSSTLQVNGMLDVPPQNLVSVPAMMGGYIKSTNLLQGMKVKKGDVLAVIQNPDYIQIQQDYLDNQSKLKFLEQEFKRQEELSKENVSSLKTFQQVRSEYYSMKAVVNGMEEKLKLLGLTPKSIEDGNISSTVNIYSPISGYVTTVNVNLGKFVNPQDVMFEIVNTDHLHAELTVFEKDITKLKVGQKIRFVLVNESSRERTAKVYLINKKIAEDRTVRVHAHLDKDDASLVPNMYLKAFIDLDNNLVNSLPDEAIVSGDGKYYIFIKSNEEMHKSEDGTETSEHKETNEEQGKSYVFKPIEVKKGVSQGGFTEVILPSSIDVTKAEVAVKGAYSILSKMNNSEEGEGHGH